MTDRTITATIPDSENVNYSKNKLQLSKIMAKHTYTKSNISTQIDNPK